MSLSHAFPHVKYFQQPPHHAAELPPPSSSTINPPVIPAYSTFNPTFPNPLIPPAQIKLLTTHAAKQVQKLALYPSHKANAPPVPPVSYAPPSPPGLPPTPSPSAAVTLAATIEVTARPTELPICARVLKTPPARACVRTGKREVIARLEIV